jgi:3-hydroxyisobutyrate dehydrogenase
MKVGFIGLGRLGKTMARRLASQGTDLVVWNRTREKAEDLGLKVAETPAALLSESEIVFLNLFDSDAVQSVLEDRGGLLEGDCKGKIIVDTTTNHFDRVLHFHEALGNAGASYLESPVLGSVVPASQGTLTVVVSGPREALDFALPYLEKIGNKIFFLGQPSLATKMKLINNLLLGVFMASIAEGIVFGEDAGVPKEQVIDILSAGAGNSAVMNAKKEKIMKEDFEAQFSSALIYKDLHYLQDLARTLKRPCFTGSIAKELFGISFSREAEDLDFSAIYSTLKDYSGR